MSNKLSVVGTLVLINDTESVGSNGFQKREFVIEIPGKYPEYPKFELIKDKCDLIDQFTTGESVEVHFNLRGRQAPNGNYYTNLQAWKVQSTEGSNSAPASAPSSGGGDSNDDVDEDLPF